MQADQSALWQVDLSAGDLKLQLYDQLKASGVLNALKARCFSLGSLALRLGISGP